MQRRLQTDVPLQWPAYDCSPSSSAGRLSFLDAAPRTTALTLPF